MYVKRLAALLCAAAMLTACASRTPPVSSSSAQAATPPTSSVPVTSAPPPSEPEPPVIEEWMIRLVNSKNGLPQDFEPALAEAQNGYQMDARAVPALTQMIADAKAQGIELYVCSAYRPYNSQERNYQNSIQSYIQQGYSEQEALSMTAAYIALPGYSEHQTGLAADIVTPSYVALDRGYAETDAAKWLYAHAAEYGFILRYPKDKTAITGIAFEPWHYRYVGVDAAREIRAQEICLEEYLAS